MASDDTARDSCSMHIVGLHAAFTSLSLLIGLVGQRATNDLKAPSSVAAMITVAVLLSIGLESLSLAVCVAQLGQLWRGRPPVRWSMLLYAQFATIAVLTSTFIVIHFVNGD